MSIIDQLRRAADAGRKVPDRLGIRRTTVSIVVETWSAAVGTLGATLVATSTTQLSPTPAVAITGWMPSAFGGGVASGATGALLAAEVRIGPITPPYPGGGYDPQTQLAPAIASPAQRVYALLVGSGFSSSGERFRITRVEGTGALSSILYAERTRQ